MIYRMPNLHDKGNLIIFQNLHVRRYKIMWFIYKKRFKRGYFVMIKTPPGSRHLPALGYKILSTLVTCLYKFITTLRFVAFFPTTFPHSLFCYDQQNLRKSGFCVFSYDFDANFDTALKPYDFRYTNTTRLNLEINLFFLLMIIFIC